jgi:hypothetical protein
MKDKPFLIESFEMDKRVEDSLAEAGEAFDSEDIILRKLAALARFFDENGLTTRKLAGADGTVDRSFVLNSTDLTTEGLAVLRKGYEKWHRQAKTPEDVRPWEKALRSVRAGE